MTSKEKAKELIDKFKPLCVNVKHTGILDGLATVMNDDFINLIAAKQCALIAVDEIISSREDDSGFDDTLSSTSSEYYTPHPMYLTYWEEVKTEIEKYNYTKPEIDLDKVIKVEPKLRKNYG